MKSKPRDTSTASVITCNSTHVFSKIHHTVTEYKVYEFLHTAASILTARFKTNKLWCTGNIKTSKKDQ